MKIRYLLAIVCLAAFAIPKFANATEDLAKLNNQALKLMATGHVDKAVPILEKAVEVAKKTLGPEDPSTDALSYNLAAAYLAMNKRSEAAEYFERIRDHYAKRFGADAPQFAAVNLDLGRTLEDSDPNRAKVALTTAVGIYEHEKTKADPGYIRALYHLGYVEFGFQNVNHAKSLYEKAVKESERLFGRDSAVTGEALLMMGQYYIATEGYRDAERKLTQALGIFGTKLQPNHPLALKTHASLLISYEGLGLQDKADKECVLLGKLAPDAEGKEAPLYQVKPAYPEMARYNASEGYVDLRFTITEIGRVTNIKVIGGQKKSTFTDPVVAAVAKWRYKPRVVKGKPVASSREVRFRFSTDYHRPSTRIKNSGETR